MEKFSEYLKWRGDQNYIIHISVVMEIRVNL